MWRELETTAIMIGLDLNYFWSLNPRQFKKHVDCFNKKEEKRFMEIDLTNYILGKYIAFSVNDPKNYPKKPFSEKETIMTDDDMERFAKMFTLKEGGVVNGN